MLSLLEIKRRIFPICQKYGIKHAYLFGSYARGEALIDSDIDIRIDKGTSTKLKGVWDINTFQSELSDALQTKVDLITALPEDDLYAIFRKHIVSDEVLIYANQ